jgi:hypothetical protein
MRLETGVGWDFARLVVIEIAHLCTRFEQPVERGAVLRQRNVEHGDLVAGPRVDALQQANVTLGPGHQPGVGRVGQP